MIKKLAYRSLSIGYPLFVFGTAFVAWSASGQADLFNLKTPPLGEGVTSWSPTSLAESKCENKQDFGIVLKSKCQSTKNN